MSFFSVAYWSCVASTAYLPAFSFNAQGAVQWCPSTNTSVPAGVASKRTSTAELPPKTRYPIKAATTTIAAPTAGISQLVFLGAGGGATGSTGTGRGAVAARGGASMRRVSSSGSLIGALAGAAAADPVGEVRIVIASASNSLEAGTASLGAGGA